MESESISLGQEGQVTLQFEALPNEVVLHIFSYLKIEDLLKCGHVSKRFRAISNDENVWPKKVTLSQKIVPVLFLQKLLDSGCKYLSLSGAISEGILNFPRASRLLYFDLSVFPNRENSEKLLESCHSLQKLSLSYIHLSSKLLSSAILQNGKTLRVLDLNNCTLCDTYHCASIDFESIQKIVENCTELTELSLRMTMLCEKSVDILVLNLTSKIEKLDLFDMSFLRDCHVKKLVTRCSKITELDLGGRRTSITKQSLNFIIEHLQSTLVKLNLAHTRAILDQNDLLKLKSMEKLTLLYYKCRDVDKRWLKKKLPNLWIYSNSFGLLDNPTIASPRHPEYDQGFWEIKCKREKLFGNIQSLGQSSRTREARSSRLLDDSRL